MISLALQTILERREAVHKDCGGYITNLFDMLICEKCNHTIDEEDIFVAWKRG